MRASSKASPGCTDSCWSTKCAIPACLAPGTSVSPIASRIAAWPASSVLNGILCAKAWRGDSSTSTPPTVKASAPMAAPFIRVRRSISDIASSLYAEVVLAACCALNQPSLERRFKSNRNSEGESTGSVRRPRTEQFFGVAGRNALRLLGRQLHEPRAILLHDAFVGEPALVDPGVRAEQK